MILLIGLLCAHLWMLMCWGLYRLEGNEMLADIAWSIGITTLASLYLLTHSNFNLKVSLYWFFLLAWGARLAGFLYWTRLRPNLQDTRYESLKKTSKHDKNTTFLINYQMQAFLQWLIALPFFFIALNSTQPINAIDIGAYLLFLIGFSIEIAADQQLLAFKKLKLKQVCQMGLWAYSRHPNYMGELLIWLSFAIAGQHLLAFISVLSLYWIMRFVTGPMTEAASIESKGEAYLNYQKTTPMIFMNLYKLFCSNKSK